MRAVVYDGYGPPEVLRVADLATPDPGPGEIRVRVRVAGVNPVDAKQRRGDFAAFAPAHFPQQLGNEYAGVVDALGRGVAGVAVGAAVLGSSTACAYADYVVVSAADAVPKPAGMSWEAAGTLPAVGQTAYSAISALAVGPGDTLLVHGAAGGVGTIAVQLARHRGATVIGTARPANHDYLRGLGAVPVSYGPGLVDRVRDLAPAGVDAALDLVGGESVTASLRLVADPRRIGTTIDAAAVTEHGIQRVGARSTAALTELAGYHHDGQLHLTIAACLPLHEASKAHRLIETAHTRGKLALHTGRQDGTT